MKSYTDLKQSKKLSEILPLETADMCYKCLGEDPYDTVMRPYTDWKEEYKGLLTRGDVNVIPCWSLAALLGVIPTMIGSILEKDALRLRIDKSGADFNIWYDNLDTGMVEEGFDIVKTNPIDACVAMIERLHELKML